MRIEKISSQQNVNFKTGLTPQIKYMSKGLDVKSYEKALKRIADVDANFNGNKAIGFCFLFVMNLCNEAFEKYKLPFNFIPPSIQLYKTEELLDKRNYDAVGFCLDTGGRVIKDKSDYNPGSIFIKEVPDDIEKINSFQEKCYSMKHSSTPHFLGSFMHEWFHNIHFSLLGEKMARGRLSQVEALTLIFTRDFHFNLIPKDFIKSKIGNYAAKSYYEFFPEVITKLMCESIDEESMALKNNPMDGLKEMPKYVQKFIEKELG